MRILKNRKPVPKPYRTNKMVEKSVQTRNPNPTKIKQKAFFCKRPFFLIPREPIFWISSGICGTCCPICSRELEAPCQCIAPRNVIDRPLHLAAVPEAKQSNQNVLSFQLGLCSAIIPPELGAAGIFEAPIFPSKIGSGGAHKANRFLARLFFSGLFERLLFFVLGDSQVNPVPKALNSKP